MKKNTYNKEFSWTWRLMLPENDPVNIEKIDTCTEYGEITLKANPKRSVIL